MPGAVRVAQAAMWVQGALLTVIALLGAVAEFDEGTEAGLLVVAAFVLSASATLVLAARFPSGQGGGVRTGALAVQGVCLVVAGVLLGGVLELGLRRLSELGDGESLAGGVKALVVLTMVVAVTSVAVTGCLLRRSAKDYFTGA
jgi:hypothetical protein